MSESTADGLNRAQRTAVTTLSGPLLVLAGAGTGKTRVITFRIAELIRSGIAPSRILAMTFTNKAAREMQQRASGLLGTKRKKKNQKKPEISTFHSLCVRILRRNAQVIGYPPNFTIYDRGDQESIARTALRDIRVGAQKLRPGDLIQQVSAWKGRGISPIEAQNGAANDADLLAAHAYERYQASLRACGAMDFDDLLGCTELLLNEHPEVRFAEASRFDHLLIDEYQDTSALQYRIVRSLAERHRNICVVGDDDQSIYGWRGAEVEHILAFKDQWPDAKVVRLEENYRSTGWVLHLANTLIAHNTVRHEKVLKPARSGGERPRFVPYEDENHEAESVISEIFQKVNREDSERVVASDIAILFRTNEQPRVFEQEMRRAGIPYRLVGGQSFFDRKEVKDLLSYLRVVSNPSDEVSLLRIINTPTRGIGTATVQALVDTAVDAGKPLWQMLPTASENANVPRAAALSIDGFIDLIEEFSARSTREPLTPLVMELIARIEYQQEIERQYKDPSEQETRWNAVSEFINTVSTYEGREEAPTLTGFLEESTLSDRDEDSEDDRKEHAVTLMTLHSAKGLEFPQVYLVGLEEGLLPHKRSLMEGQNTIPEERRLAYVGVTRAQDALTLSFCKTRMKWGKQRAQIPSRFLMEMRGESEKALAIAAQAEEQFQVDPSASEDPHPSKGRPKKKKTTRAKDQSPASAPAPPPRSKRAPTTSAQPIESKSNDHAPPAAPPSSTRRSGADSSEAITPPEHSEPPAPATTDLPQSKPPQSSPLKKPGTEEAPRFVQVSLFDD